MRFFSHRKMKRELMGLLDVDGYNERTKKAARTWQMEHGISDGQLWQLRTAHFKASIEPILRRIVAAGRYTRDDEAQIGELSSKLGISPKLPPAIKVYRDLWEYREKGTFEPRPVKTDLRLAPGEVCFHRCTATRGRARIRQEYRGYVGNFVRFGMSNAVTIGVNQSLPSYHAYESFVAVSKGVLVVTNKRLEFVASRQPTTISYEGLIDHRRLSDGLEITRMYGDPDVFRLSILDLEYVDALLSVIGPAGSALDVSTKSPFSYPTCYCGIAPFS